MFSNLILIMLNFFHFQTVDCQQIDTIPDYCFNNGDCQFRFEPESLRLCATQCGSVSGFPSMEVCQDSELTVNRSYIQCPIRDYVEDFFPNENQQDSIQILAGICDDERQCSNVTQISSIIYFDTPKFIITRSSLSVYDSIEHGINFTGSHLNAFYQPYIVVNFTRSKLVDPQLRFNCSLTIHCTALDANILNCTKPPFRDECLPTVASEFGSWDADFTFYSHYLPQTVIDKRLLIYQVPTFSGFIWKAEYNKFFIQSKGDFYLKPKVFCVDLSDVNGKIMDANVTRFMDFLTFELDPYRFYKKILNCSLVMDRHVFPLGTGYVDVILISTFSLENYISEIILIAATGFVFLVACYALVVINNARRNNELRQQSALNPFMSFSLKGIFNKPSQK